ncbi:MAG TPA: DUF5130 family protein [Frankiaceae bacterium]|nr:DUF5130 family protein [Frankiaceae bacterium]
MAAGDGLTPEQHERVERARQSAEEATGMRFWVRIGPFSMDPRIEAERLLTNLLDDPHEPGVLILLGPGERRLEVMTSATAKRHLSDSAVGLAVLTMTSSFGVGDLVGGLVNGLRQLSDSAGHGEAASTGSRRDSGRAPVHQRGLEHSSGEPLSRPPEAIES